MGIRRTERLASRWSSDLFEVSSVPSPDRISSRSVQDPSVDF
jgi:hypothetical protein